MSLTAIKLVDYALSIGYEKCGIVNISAMKGYAEKLQVRINRFPEVKEKQEGFFDFANLEKTDCHYLVYSYNSYCLYFCYENI